ITVNSADDPGTVGDGELTLREAIRIANGTLLLSSLSDAERAQVTGMPGSSSLIRFGIAGATPHTPHTIAVTSPLPDIVKTMTIDGGEIDTGDAPSNGTGPIELNGRRIAGPSPFVVGGLVIRSNNCVVRELVINGFLPPENSGVFINGGSSNRVEGCFIGTDLSGTRPVGNGFGVLISNGFNNIIGGTAPGVGNVISGNTIGVKMEPFSATNVIQGNLIGADVTRKVAVKNSIGGQTGTPGENTLGGAAPGAGNIISGNQNTGIANASGIPTPLFVFGNFVGLDVTGAGAMGNGANGIAFDEQAGGAIVGPVPSRNMFRANGQDGVGLVHGVRFTGMNVVIGGNLIGTDVTGTTSIGNALDGVTFAGSFSCRITGNTISGNGRNGVTINGEAQGETAENHITGNSIGTDSTGMHALGNGLNGVLVENGTNTSKHFVEDNVIGFNRATGVAVPNRGAAAAATQITISANSIFTNGGLGIDIDLPGVSPNDEGDTDTGANDVQNFPILDSASSDDLNTTISGSLNSLAGHDFEIEFFANTPDSAPTQAPVPGSCAT